MFAYIDGDFMQKVVATMQQPDGKARVGEAAKDGTLRPDLRKRGAIRGVFDGRYRAKTSGRCCPAGSTADGSRPTRSTTFDAPRRRLRLPRCRATKRAAGRYFRIPRSADVSASENAGRANSRSAYFMSGAACFGIWIP